MINEGNARRPFLPEQIIINGGKMHENPFHQSTLEQMREIHEDPFTRARYDE